MKKFCRTAIATAAISLVPASLFALPFNDDMVDLHKRPGAMMRQRPDGSVPVGFGDPKPLTKDAAMKLENPIAGDALSTANGARLFRVNCFPCHGSINSDDTKYAPGPTSVNSGGVLPGVNIGSKLYAEKTDGYIYATIHFGGLAIMPAMGWKLSPTEHWDIVNYVRSVQRAKN